MQLRDFGAGLKRRQPIEAMANDPSEKVPPSKPPEAAAESSPPPSKLDADALAAAAAPPKAAPPAAPAKPAAPAAGVPAKPAAPAPKPNPMAPVPLDSEFVQRLRAKFGDAIREATLDRKQAIVTVEVGKLREISRHCRDEEKFDLLVDLTAVDWPNREKRFDVIAILYSFPKNERVRLKAHAGENEPVPSVCEVWPAANWLERECFDMFGIVFEGHPNLKRILLPDEWQGHPLRKDYDILKQDTAWVRENLGIDSGQ